jgi:hypothetical protein
MFLWLIEQDYNSNYDTYSKAIVVAEDADKARHTHPSENEKWNGNEWVGGIIRDTSWAPPNRVSATRIGVADDPTPRVVCASFHAG